MLLFCGCDGYMGKSQGAEYQDLRYGKGQRVHVADQEKEKFTCTVCGVQRSKGPSVSQKVVAKSCGKKGERKG
jgi:hypothetical protein